MEYQCRSTSSVISAAKTGRVTDQFAGRRIYCPRCDRYIDVPPENQTSDATEPTRREQKTTGANSNKSTRRPLELIEDPPLKGEGVVALGAPFGLDSTASEGIVSAIRSAEELEFKVGIHGHAGTWIQTTTPISPGNSGSPLVNRRGQVVAVNTLTLKHGQNLNFGISAMDIRRALRPFALGGR